MWLLNLPLLFLSLRTKYGDLFGSDRVQIVEIYQSFSALFVKVGNLEGVSFDLGFGESCSESNSSSLAFGEPLYIFSATPLPLCLETIDGSTLRGELVVVPANAQGRTSFAGGIIAQYLLIDSDLHMAESYRTPGRIRPYRWCEALNTVTAVKVPAVTFGVRTIVKVCKSKRG